MQLNRRRYDGERVVDRMCLEKEAFLSRDEAKRAKHLVSKQKGHHTSVYQCPNCKCFHLTSWKNQD